jgi:hypothetical protein
MADEPGPSSADEWIDRADLVDDRPDGPALLNCERCERPAAENASDARHRTRGWRLPLYCDDCDAWWSRMVR